MNIFTAHSWRTYFFLLVSTVALAVAAPSQNFKVTLLGTGSPQPRMDRYSENLIHFSQGTDVLIHEVIDPAAFRTKNPSVSPERFQAIVGHHTTAEQAGTIFTQVKPKLAVYSHIVPGDATDLLPLTRKTYSGPLEVGEDSMSFEIGEKVVVHRPAKVN